MTKILADYPALMIVDGKGREYKHNDTFAIPFQSRRWGTTWKSFKLGSVEADARQRGEDVEAAIKREKEIGGRLYFAYGLASSITAWKREKEVVPGLEFGDVITFEGKTFRLEPTWNENVKLVEVEAAQ